MTLRKESSPVLLEFYGILPSAFSLLTFSLAHLVPHRIPVLVYIILVGGIGLAIPTLELTWVALVICFSRAFFRYPLVEFIGAVLLGVYLLKSCTEQLRKRTAWVTLLFLCAGMLTQTDERWSMMIVPLLIIGSVVTLGRIFINGVSIIASPWTQFEDKVNEGRFTLYCVAFLSFGAVTWSYLISALHSPSWGALAHVLLTLFGLHPLIDLMDSARNVAEQKQHFALVAIQRDLDNRANQLAQASAEVSGLKEQREALQANVQELERIKLSKQKQLQRELADAQKLAHRKALESFYRQPWDFIVSHFNSAPAVAMPDGATLHTQGHVFLGLLGGPQRKDAEAAPEPVFLPVSVLRDHVHILGGTGAGKTTRGIIPIAVQLLRHPTEQFPLVFVDLKGEPALFHTVREETERAGRDFRFFSLQSKKATYRFNPFVGISHYAGNLNEKVQPILDALALNHGEGYGSSFFTRQHRSRLLRVLRSNPHMHTFRELQDAIRASYRQEKRSHREQEQDELLLAIEGVFEYPQLFTTSQEESSDSSIIRFDHVLEQNQVAYFWLPAPTQQTSVQEVGKLILYNLFFAAMQRKDHGESKQAFLFIDEFQRIIGQNLKLFLEQSRSYGIGLVLANHNLQQLNSEKGKLQALVQSNVRVSLHLGSMDDEEIKMLSAASGEMRDTLMSTSEGESQAWGQAESVGFSTSNAGSHENSTTSESNNVSSEQSFQQYLRPTLRPDDIREAFSANEEFVLWVRRGEKPICDFSGRPVIVQGSYAMPHHLFLRRDKMPWPRVPGETILSDKEYIATQKVTESSMIQTLLLLKETDY